MRIQNEAFLNDLLSLDNFWPKDDVAIHDAAKRHGVNKRVVFESDAWVNTSGSRFAHIWRKILTERRHPSDITDDAYAADAPASSTPYEA